MITYYVEATNGACCRHQGATLNQAAQRHARYCIGRLGRLTILEVLAGGRTFFRFYPRWITGKSHNPRTFLVRSRPKAIG